MADLMDDSDVPYTYTNTYTNKTDSGGPIYAREPHRAPHKYGTPVDASVLVVAIEKIQIALEKLQLVVNEQCENLRVSETMVDFLRSDLAATKEDLTALEDEFAATQYSANETAKTNRILEEQNREYIADYEALQGEAESLYEARERMKKIIGQDFLHPEHIEQLKKELKIIP